MLRSRLFSRQERASQSPASLCGWGRRVLLIAFDYQLQCVITTHVPLSIRAWTKYPHFTRPTCTPTTEHAADHLNVHMHRCYAYHRYVCILYDNSSIIIAARKRPLTHRLVTGAPSCSQVYPTLSSVLWDVPTLITITPMVLLYQSSEIPVTPKACRNALLRSDILPKLMPPSLHSTSSQTLLEASSN